MAVDPGGAKEDRLCDGAQVDGAEQVVDGLTCGQKMLSVSHSSSG
jgi:hypothetical protein